MRARYVLCFAGVWLLAGRAPAEWHFTEVSAAAGVAYEHGYVPAPTTEPQLIAGGVAAGDYDGDRFPDLYVVRGNVGPNLLFHNRGDGTFEEVGAAAGVAIDGQMGSGPTFVDLDGDGRLDLTLGGIHGAKPRLFRNRGDGTFEEFTATSGITSIRDTFAISAGDYDADGDLDLFLSHWNTLGGAISGASHMWRNDGGLFFSPVDWTVGIGALYVDRDHSFSANFTDVDDDGDADVVLSGDFGTSQVFRNDGAGRFDVENDVLTDENGMGTAVGDYDNDGDFDWFVSSIWDPDGVAEGNWGVTGNRLYRNRGDGTFEDATDAAGVRIGYWGWGSCFADFNNDGHLDLYHTNGFQAPSAVEFFEDPSRLFVSNGDGTFTERGAELGVADGYQGRGVVCFDYDRDGDVDLFVANNSGPSRLYRNDGDEQGHYLGVRLRGGAANSEAIGARIWVVAGGVEQVQEIRAGNNFVSQNPAEAHFGLGDATEVEQLRIRWPDGEEELRTGVAVDQLLEITQEGVAGEPAEIPTLSAAGKLLAGLVLLAAGALLLRRRAVTPLTLLVAALAALAPLAHGDTPAAGAAAITTVVVVRHAEKAQDGTSNPGLTAQGEARARALVEVLAEADVAAIYTTEYRRTQLTAAPLAAHFGLTPEVREMRGFQSVPRYAEALAREVRTAHPGQTVVIVGHSNTVPDVVRALGGRAVAEMSEEEYGHLFIVQIPPSGDGRLIKARYGD